jgi:hypothetical protein
MKASIIHTQRFLASMAAASLAAAVVVPAVTSPPSAGGGRATEPEPDGASPVAGKPEIA